LCYIRHFVEVLKALSHTRESTTYLASVSCGELKAKKATNK